MMSTFARTDSIAIPGSCSASPSDDRHYDVHVPPLDIAEPAQGREERLKRGSVGRVERIRKHPDAIDLRARLRFTQKGHAEQ